MKDEMQDRIDNYLLNRMSDEERKSFEADLTNDEELKQQLEFTEKVIRALRSRNEKLAAMEEWKDDYTWEENGEEPTNKLDPTDSRDDECPDTPEKKQPSRRKMIYWISGIAAIFIAGFFFYQNNYSYQTKKEEIIKYEKDGPSVQKNAKKTHDLKDIKQLLNQKKYEEALIYIDLEIKALEKDLNEIEQTAYPKEEMKEEMKRLKHESLTDLYKMKVQALQELGRDKEAQQWMKLLNRTENDALASPDTLNN